MKKAAFGLLFCARSFIVIAGFLKSHSTSANELWLPLTIR
jgi:hypothetical protein